MAEATAKSGGFMDLMNEKILPAVNKIQNNMYVSSIMGGMMGAMGVMMASAIFQLIYAFPIDAWTNFLTNIGIYDLLVAVVNVFNCTAVFIAFGIGYTLGEKKGVDPFQTGVASLACFLIVTPTTTIDGSNYFSFTYLGAMGIFTAMICGLLAPTLYAFCIKHDIVIKLPESVPVFVSKNLGPIPSALVTVVPFVAMRGLCAMTPYGSLTNLIYTLIQTPLTGLGNSLPAHLICIAVCCLLWWFGVHGTLVILSVMTAVWTPAMVENLAAYNAGDPAVYVLSYMSFFLICQFMGGPGCMFGLYLDLAFFTKSERYKAQGKVGLVPGLFNIIEPTVFGLPVCLNFILLIPFVGLPVLVYLLYYFLATAGIIGVPVLSISVMVLPGPIAGFLLGGGISLGIFVLAMLALSVVVYYPFIKVLDNQALAEEKAFNEAKAAAEAEAVEA